jgi:hypothetical protein
MDLFSAEWKASFEAANDPALAEAAYITRLD